MRSTIRAAPLQDRRPWAVLAVILAAAVLDLLDATITNLAAPVIAADLGGGEALIQWLGAGYALALGILLVPAGRLGDKYGRRRLFLIGVGGFTIASVACGLAGDPGTLIAARIVQGTFGALMIPQGFGILGAVFPRDQLGKAFSVFAPALGASSVGGPVLAGFLIQADVLGLGWRAMFLINIVLGGAAFLAAARLLPADRPSPTETEVQVDGIGAGLLGLAMAGLLYGLIDGSAHGWGLLAYLCLAGGVVFAGLFWVRQRTAANPLIEPSLLRNRGFTAGLVLGVVFFAAVSGLLYVMSLLMQYGLRFTPMQAALGLAPLAMGIVIASVACHRLIAKLGRDLILIGLLTTLAGTGLLLFVATNDPHGVWALVPPALIIGLGMGACFGTVFDVTLGDVDPRQAGSASGSLTAIQQLANAVGAAAVTTVYFHASDGGGTAAATRSLPAVIAADPAGPATRSLLVVIAAILACCALVRLLPRKAQPRHSS
ncbi:MFS transporter [Nonomuraea rosea]|uniref:MFS transporter n=1 Tax=Nonomuraea rosea TaxID=638574 RepID=A0ABP6YV65_9ACTN